jgi:capsular exopolysaccharide family
MSVNTLKEAVPGASFADRKPEERKLVTPTRLPMVLTDPVSINAEAVRSLRTRVVAQHVQEGRRSLAICTPAAESGCTFVATNLAAAISQIGIKTALIDADLRAPGVAAAFGLPESNPGLSEYLADPEVTIDDILLDEVLPDLAIITAGVVPSNPQELLSASRFPVLVNQLLREFDLTIFDTTPTNSCTDAQRVANIASYSLIVGRKHNSKVGDVKTLTKLLLADKSTVIGSVLNDF